jgi:hypothetical protein
MIICPTTSPSFWRKIDRTIGLKTPVRPFDLPNFKGKGQQLSSNPDCPALGETKRIQVVQTDSKSKKNIKPVHRSPMFTEKNKNKPAGPSGILTNGHLAKHTMRKAKQKTAAHAAKTKTSTISQWSHIRWTDDNTHPVSGDEMMRTDRPKTRNRRRNKPQAQARGGGIKSYDDYVHSFAEFLYLKEVNQ